jgi:anti-sigma28 factor (negative regulator of flagellin synthesis)
MGSAEERERRIRKLRSLLQAGLYAVDADRLARAIVNASRRKVFGQLDVTPRC